MELVPKSSKIKSTVVQLMMDLIVKVKETCSFDIRWIKGHSGNKGQELADGLAKEAARESHQIRITEVMHLKMSNTMFSTRQPANGNQDGRATWELQRILFRWLILIK